MKTHLRRMLTLLAWMTLAAAPEVVVSTPAGQPEALDWNQPVWCVRLSPTKVVPSGEFRVQCDVKTKRCLAAPRSVLVEGVAGPEPLARVRGDCWEPYATDEGGLLLERAKTEAWPFVEAVAEAPPGWFRDERGRVMQVNFDLGRRVYFGGGWSPFYRPDGNGSFARGRPELGVSITWQGDEGRHLHRLHLVEGAAWLGKSDDLRFELSSARYDFSVRRDRPPLWLTTFVGRPRRFDLDLNVTWAAEVGRFEYLGSRAFLGIVEADVVVDLWHSADLDSFVRVRAGPGLESDLTAKAVYFRPAVAVELDLTLDRDGFHRLTASALAEKLFWEPAVAGRPVSPQRLKLKAGYEVILLALNDYPLTLVLDARATWRDDVPGLNFWELAGNAGLRFSLWAPARYGADLVRVPPPHWRTAPPPAKDPVLKPSPAPPAADPEGAEGER